MSVLEKRLIQALRLCFFTVCLLWGIYEAYRSRFEANSDGISYLDLARAIVHFDVSQWANGYWSPLYAWILALVLAVTRVSPAHEFQLLHGLNFLLFLGAAVMAEFFLTRLSQFFRRSEEVSNGIPPGIFEGASRLLFYGIFVSIHLIYPTMVSLLTPDLLVECAVYGAGILSLKMLEPTAGRRQAMALGATVGAAYLAKAIFFPLGLGYHVCLGLMLLLCGRPLRHAFVSLGSFFLIGLPLVLALSVKNHHFTFGESGKLNYSWIVNEYPGVVDPSKGQVLLDSPRVWDYSSAPRSTYPFWTDPPRWLQGDKPYFKMENQVRALRLGGRGLAEILQWIGGAFYFLGALIILALIFRKHSSLSWRKSGVALLLMLPSIVGIFMYVIIGNLRIFEIRYVTGFVSTILFVSLLHFDLHPRLWRIPMSLAALTAAAMTISTFSFGGMLRPIEKIRAARAEKPVHWEAAQKLHALGFKEGDTLVSTMKTYHAYWAYLARVYVVAEFDETQKPFSELPTDVQQRTLAALRKTGIKALATDKVPEGLKDLAWQSIIETSSHNPGVILRLNE